MTSFNEYLAHGNAWLFIPAAIVLGALHGLEPGHSKTMMAAFIVAIRGTVKQAMLLGISATISHTAIIWILAVIGLHYAGRFDVEHTEPYFQMATGFLVIGMALWMFLRTRRESHHAHHHYREHGPHGGMILNTGHGFVEVSVFENDVPPQFRLYFFDSQNQSMSCPKSEAVSVEMVRPDGTRQKFKFINQGDFLQSTTNIPEPHEFRLLLRLSHGDHAHTFQTEFTEHHHPLHDEDVGEYEDAHQREHAEDFKRRFANRPVTTGQLILFGLTGGLLPCPSAFAVLLVCLQLKQFTLGFAIVLAFSLGLALTLVTVGSVAALSVHHASKRFKGFGELARKAPYVSSVVLMVIGLLVGLRGLRTILH